MAIYRVLRRLDRGRGRIIEPGTLTRLEWLRDRPEDVLRLLNVGAVAEVSPPPLAVLDGWQERSKRLAEWDIHDAVQLMEANAELLADQVGVRPRTIRKWQQQAEECLLAERSPRD